jgi:hypothetical protein
MSDPWQPQGQGYGWDTYARKMAQEATEKAAAATTRTCRLASARTGLLLAVGSSVDVPVAWPTPMPSAQYTVEPVAGPGILGNASLAVKSQTAAGCVITVTAQLAVAAGATVLVHARSS